MASMHWSLVDLGSQVKNKKQKTGERSGLKGGVETLLQQMQDKFQIMSDQIIGRIDDMSSRIDDLEKNIADLMTQAGVEELDPENKIPTAQKS